MQQNMVKIDGRQHRSVNLKLRRCVEVLVFNPDLQEAAKVLGVHRATLRRWLAAPAFMAEYHRRADEVYAESAYRSQTMVNDAIAQLHTNMIQAALEGNREQSTRAADLLLLHTQRLKESAALAGRMVVLEQVVMAAVGVEENKQGQEEWRLAATNRMIGNTPASAN